MNRVSTLCVFAGLLIGALPEGNGQDVKGAAPATATLRHSDLSVYQADDGTLKPIRTADDWAIRRKQILAGTQEATGPLPARDQQPAFDIKITEDIRIEGVRRLTMTIAVDESDRLPLDLYLPKAVADSIDAGKLLDAESTAKLAAMVALHPTGPAGKRIVAGEGKAARGLIELHR